MDLLIKSSIVVFIVQFPLNAAESSDLLNHTLLILIKIMTSNHNDECMGSFPLIWSPGVVVVFTAPAALGRLVGVRRRAHSAPVAAL